MIAVDPGASDVRVERLTVDTSAARNTDVQTHAIGIGSRNCPDGGNDCGLAVTDLTVRDVTFRHPVQTGGTLKGDCIRIFGERPTMPVKRVTITGSSFVDCDRSGIAVQRNVSSLAVLDNHFGERIGDPPFGPKPPAATTGLRLIGNSFADSTVNASVSLVSYHYAIVSGNTFTGRGLFVYRCSDIVVADNTFDVTGISGGGVVEVRNVADNVKIDNNVIRRHGVAGPASGSSRRAAACPARCRSRTTAWCSTVTPTPSKPTAYAPSPCGTTTSRSPSPDRCPQPAATPNFAPRSGSSPDHSPSATSPSR